VRHRNAWGLRSEEARAANLLDSATGRLAGRDAHCVPLAGSDGAEGAWGRLARRADTHTPQVFSAAAWAPIGTRRIGVSASGLQATSCVGLVACRN